MLNVPVVDRDKCQACGTCVSVCDCNILVIIDGVLTIIEKSECTACRCWCTKCESVCPHGAITCPFEIVLE